MSYTQQQLDAAWARYVVLKQADVISLTDPHSAAYEADFANMVAYMFTSRLYGWGSPRTPWDGTGGNSASFNGPTQS